MRRRKCVSGWSSRSRRCWACIIRPNPRRCRRDWWPARPEQAAAVLAQIQPVLPAVAVFLELGREQGAVTPDGLRVFRLADIARNARLPSVEHVLQALGIIDTALRRAVGDPEATLFALDPQGHCFVAEATSRSILAVWNGVLAHAKVESRPAAPASAGPIAAMPAVPG